MRIKKCRGANSVKSFPAEDQEKRFYAAGEETLRRNFSTREKKGEKTMEDKKELNLDEMETIQGGVQRTVNTGIQGVHAAIRAKATKDSAQIASVVNGTVVDTVTDQLYYDPVSNRNFVEVRYVDKNGKSGVGWIAASIVGMPR